MVNIEQLINDAKQILKFELEGELRKQASIAISGYVPKFPIKRTGNLIRNIRATVNGNKIVITMPDYAKYIEYGTGIYGPNKKPIRPTTKKALAFNGFVFKEVDGRPATPFIRPTFHAKFVKMVESSFKKALKLQNGNS